MVVYTKQIEKHLVAELPFMVTEKILMEAVNRGCSRQQMHEVVKEHSVAAGLMVKQQGRDNDLLLRLAEDPRIPLSGDELTALTGDYRQFTGRACRQTEEFLAEHVRPVLEKNKDMIGTIDASLHV